MSFHHVQDRIWFFSSQFSNLINANYKIKDGFLSQLNRKLWPGRGPGKLKRTYDSRAD